VQKLTRVGRAHYTVPNQVCQVQIYILDAESTLSYNYFINRREPIMTERDFFRADQEAWYQEFVDAELSTKVVNTNPQPEKFTLEDIPF
jgi:hypothetical protein